MANAPKADEPGGNQQGWLAAGRRLAQRFYEQGKANDDLHCFVGAGYPFEILYGHWKGAVFGGGEWTSTHLPSDPIRVCLGLFRSGQFPPEQDGSPESSNAYLAAIGQQSQDSGDIRKRLDEVVGWFNNRATDGSDRLAAFVGGETEWNYKTWLLAVHRLAWAGRRDTTLACQPSYPAFKLIRMEIEALDRAEARGDWLTQDDRESKLAQIRAAQWEKQKAYRPNERQFLSVLPCDPFTASALAIEWIIDQYEASDAADHGNSGWRGDEAHRSEGDFIERLLAGPNCVVLSDTELAFLEANIPPLLLQTIQQEKRATGQSETLARRNKLIAIRDFNRNLRNGATGETASDDRVNKSDARPERDSIEQLEQKTPSLDKSNGTWLNNKKAAEAEGIETRTLAKYRTDGEANADKTFGRDANGRLWRREGTPNAHPWYLKSSLVSQRKP